MVDNITPLRLRKPGMYVLTTSQRFMTQSPDPTISEMDGIKEAILNHPDTRMADCHEFGEVCNRPLTTVDYPFYRSSVQLKGCIFDYVGAASTIRRPMTVTWILFPYVTSTTPSELQPNQDYRYSIYTQLRARHNMSSLLSVVAKNPSLSKTEQRIERAAMQLMTE
jgi:hypothetical protein